MKLEEAIFKIINENFKLNSFFDSHSVINELLKKEYHQAYLDNFPKGCTVAQYHGQIAQNIFESKLAEKAKIEGKDILVQTNTIYGDLSENHLWKRI